MSKTQAEYSKAFKERHPERVRDDAAQYRNSNRARIRDRQLRKRYGIGTDERAALLEKQKDRCALCDKAVAFGARGYRAAHVDHDHVSGRVRGILCGGCNTALGKLGDSVQSIRNVLRYLEQE